MFHGGTLDGAKYPDEILISYGYPHSGATGNDFILMNYNTQSQGAGVVEDYLQGHDSE